MAAPVEGPPAHALAAAFHERFASSPMPGKVVPPANWHLTLRFLGPTDEVAFDKVTRQLDEAELGGPFTIRLAGLGAFPRPARAAVFWLGVTDGSEELAALAAVVEECVVAAGFPPEDRPYRGHLTLSRLRPPQDLTDLVSGSDLPPVRLPVQRVVVYRSVQGSGGVTYEELGAYAL